MWQAPCYSWRAPTPYTKQHTARPHHRAPRQPYYRRGLAASRNTVDPPLHQHNLESTARGRNIAGYLPPPSQEYYGPLSNSGKKRQMGGSDFIVLRRICGDVLKIVE